ncbi:transcriptional regulator [Streptomyces sp. NPDC093221]|uniref:transcriptional regulator n=1 Tax=Streptomyces sp. NPDC093221 TaxID=3366032 RepID=UPI00381A9F19
MTADAKPNNVIRDVREAQFRMSRTEFARHVNATASTLGENTGCTPRLIAAWERGEVASPRPVYERVLHKLTGRSLTDLGFSPRRATISTVAVTVRRATYGRTRTRTATGHGGPIHIDNAFVQEPDSGTLEDMIRREFLRLVSVTGAIVALPQPVAPPETGAAPTEDMRERSTLNADLWSVYGLTSTKQSVYPLVREQLASLTSALRGGQRASDHRELCGMVGDIAQLAGEVWFDANRYTEAAQCYLLAGDASKEAGDRDLWACALVRHSFVSLYARQYEEALPLLEAAAALARNGDGELPTRHWVASVRAQVLAGLGDADGCNRALDEAAGVQDLTGPAPSGWLRFTGDRLAEERGAAYISLGRLDLAEQALTRALREPLSPRRQGSVLTDLAVIGARRKDIDRLVSHGTGAVDVAYRTRSGYMIQKLHGLRSHLTPYVSDRRVRELSDRMTALGVRT